MGNEGLKKLGPLCRGVPRTIGGKRQVMSKIIGDQELYQRRLPFMKLIHHAGGEVLRETWGGKQKQKLSFYHYQWDQNL